MIIWDIPRESPQIAIKWSLYIDTLKARVAYLFAESKNGISFCLKQK